MNKAINLKTSISSFQDKLLSLQKNNVYWDLHAETRRVIDDFFEIWKEIHQNFTPIWNEYEENAYTCYGGEV